MDYLNLQTYNRDHDRQMDMAQDVDELEYAKSRRARERQNRIRGRAFIEELRAGWRLEHEVQEAQVAYNKLLHVWRMADIPARRVIEPKLWSAQDRLDKAKASLKGGA